MRRPSDMQAWRYRMLRMVDSLIGNKGSETSASFISFGSLGNTPGVCSNKKIIASKAVVVVSIPALLFQSQHVF